jgi:hypothetical protein
MFCVVLQPLREDFTAVHEETKATAEIRSTKTRIKRFIFLWYLVFRNKANGWQTELARLSGHSKEEDHKSFSGIPEQEDWFWRGFKETKIAPDLQAPGIIKQKAQKAINHKSLIFNYLIF